MIDSAHQVLISPMCDLMHPRRKTLYRSTKTQNPYHRIIILHLSELKQIEIKSIDSKEHKLFQVICIITKAPDAHDLHPMKVFGHLLMHEWVYNRVFCAQVADEAAYQLEMLKSKVTDKATKVRVTSGLRLIAEKTHLSLAQANDIRIFH